MAVSSLRLLLVWLHECPPAVAALLDYPAHLPLLVDLVTGRQAPALPASTTNPTPSFAGGIQPSYAPVPGVGPSGPASGHMPPLPLGGGAAAAAAAGTAIASGSSSNSSGDAVVCGLAACVLAACVLYGKPPPAAAAAAAPPPSAPSSELVLDVLLSRVGLTHFFYRLEDLRRSPPFVAAMASAAAAQQYRALPRAPAAGAGEGEAADGPQAAGEQADGAGRASGGGSAGAAGESRGTGGADGGAALGHEVAVMVVALDGAVRQRAMELFARPSGHKAQVGPDACCGWAAAERTVRVRHFSMGMCWSLE